jgi:hypothetical protein
MGSTKLVIIMDATIGADPEYRPDSEATAMSYSIDGKLLITGYDHAATVFNVRPI